MVFCSLDVLKKPSKKEKTRIKKKIVEVVKQGSYRKRDRDDEILGFELGFVG